MLILIEAWLFQLMGIFGLLNWDILFLKIASTVVGALLFFSIVFLIVDISEAISDKERKIENERLLKEFSIFVKTELGIGEELSEMQIIDKMSKYILYNPQNKDLKYEMEEYIKNKEYIRYFKDETIPVLKVLMFLVFLAGIGDFLKNLGNSKTKYN